MLRVLNLHKYFGDRTIFQSVSLSIGRGQRTGLIGPNGSGKSTLLKIMTGQIEPDQGCVAIDPAVSVGYLPKRSDDMDLSSVGAFIMPDGLRATQEMRALELVMAQQSFNADIQAQYQSAIDRFEQAGGYQLEGRIERVLAGLNLKHIDPERTLGSLSGGEKTRIALARVLILDFDLLLLDEPTNNLDQESLLWLEASLKERRGACLIVSHDRRFLDAVTTKTLVVEPLTSAVKEYGGNYSWYKERKRQEEERQLREFNEQQARIRQLQADVRAIKCQALKTENSTTNDYLRGRSKKVAAKAKARESRLKRMISQGEHKEKPRVLPQMRLKFDGRKLVDSPVLYLKEVEIRRGGEIILEHINLEICGSTRVALTGLNGAGKSTLLETITGNLEPHHGEIFRRQGLKLGYLSQDKDKLPDEECVLNYFRARLDSSDPLQDEGRARTFLHRFQFSGDQVLKPIHRLSPGERTKLKLSIFMAAKVDLLILDEPTNHLDLPALECLEEALKSFPGALIAVSHDRYFLDQLRPDLIWRVERKTVLNAEPEVSRSFQATS